MREWWNNLVLREKQTLALGAFFVVLALIYLLLWAPLNDRAAMLRNQIRQHQTLLVWMEDADKRIQALEKNSQQKPNANSGASLLSIVQKQINGTPFVSALNQLHQVENDSIELTFQQVDFDKLMVWMIELTKREGLVITQMNVTPGATAGMAAVTVVLKAG